MTIYKAARVAALMAGGSLLLAATPGLAQRAPRPNQQAQPAQGQSEQAPAQRQFNLSRGEQAAVAPLLTAADAALTAAQQGQAPNWAAVQALLPAAQVAAKGADARYLVARVQYQIASGTNNIAAQEQAANALLANSATPADEAARLRAALGVIVNRRAEVAFETKDYATAERLYSQLLQATPTDQRLIENLRIVRARLADATAVQQIQSAEAGGQRASEDVYRRALTNARAAGRRPEALTGLGRLVRAYPTAANWRTAVDFVRELPGDDPQLLLDIYRFAQTAKVIQPAEYLVVAQTLDQTGLPGETKAVIDAGIAAGALQASQADVARLLGVTNRRIAEDRAGLPSQIQQARSAANGRQARIAADVLFGYGRHAEAAELYRLALSKGGEDPNLVNTRLGASLALAGQQAEAQAALRAVTGPRAELAALWLAWLERSPG